MRYTTRRTMPPGPLKVAHCSLSGLHHRIRPFLPGRGYSNFPLRRQHLRAVDKRVTLPVFSHIEVTPYISVRRGRTSQPDLCFYFITTSRNYKLDLNRLGPVVIVERTIRRRGPYAVTLQQSFKVLPTLPLKKRAFSVVAQFSTTSRTTPPMGGGTDCRPHCSILGQYCTRQIDNPIEYPMYNTQMSSTSCVVRGLNRNQAASGA